MIFSRAPAPFRPFLLQREGIIRLTRPTHSFIARAFSSSQLTRPSLRSAVSHPGCSNLTFCFTLPKPNCSGIAPPQRIRLLQRS